MKLKIVSLIKKQEPEFKAAEQEYLRRISKFTPCELVEIRRAEIHEDRQDAAKILRDEARKLEGVLKERAVLVVLDKAGKEYNSEELSTWLAGRMSEGNELVFVLGGPLGLSEEIRQRARWKISLSKLTFTHKLARVILLEALYRALEIGRGSRYHK